jgi:hypothetical protein
MVWQQLEIRLQYLQIDALRKPGSLQFMQKRDAVESLPSNQMLWHAQYLRLNIRAKRAHIVQLLYLGQSITIF